MLWNSKIITTHSGPRTYEFREGTGGSGEPVYIIVSFMGEGIQDYTKGRTYHEEWFKSYTEAVAWYDNCN